MNVSFFSIIKRLIFAGVIFVGVLTPVWIGISFRNKPPAAQNVNKERQEVLAASDSLFTLPSVMNFNIATIFNEKLTAKKDVEIQGNLILKGGVEGGTGFVTGITAGSGISVTGGNSPTITNTGVTSIGGQTGAVVLTAGDNISISGATISASFSGISSLSAGTGISVSGNEITNSDRGSSQNIFKSFGVSGQDSILAGSNTDAFTFLAGSGITLTTNAANKALTIASSGSSSGVTSLNSLVGILTIAGAGINTVSATGSTVTVTATEADTLGTVTTRGGGVNTNLNPTAANTYSLGTSTTNQYAAVNAQTVYQNGNQVCDNSNNCPSAGISGTTNYIAKFGSSTTVTNSLIYDNGTNIGIGTSTPNNSALLTVGGNIVPTTDLSFDIGSPTLRYNHVYADNISASGSASFNDVIIAGKTSQVVDNTNLANGKDVFVYEVKQDADSGKWINSEKVQANSWYNETIDHTSSACVLGTDDRCGSRSFPQKITIVATSTRVYIYDTTDNSLWMTINTGSGYAIDSTATINAVHALNGSVYVATTKGLVQFDFINDAINRFDYNSGSGGRAGYLGNIGQRNTNKGYGSRSSWGQIASDQVNGVYATLINGKLFVAVSTLGGASVIDISDQRVVRYINN